MMKFSAKTLITTNLVNRLAYEAGHSAASGKYKHATDYKQSRWHSTEGLKDVGWEVTSLMLTTV
jgi:hypothetical protein